MDERKVIYNFVDFDRDLGYSKRTEYNFESAKDASDFIVMVWKVDEVYYNDAAQGYNYVKARLVDEGGLETAIVCGEEDDVYQLAYIEKAFLTLANEEEKETAE